MYHSLVGHKREDTEQRVNDPTPEALEENKQAKSPIRELMCNKSISFGH